MSWADEGKGYPCVSGAKDIDLLAYCSDIFSDDFFFQPGCLGHYDGLFDRMYPCLLGQSSEESLASFHGRGFREGEIP